MDPATFIETLPCIMMQLEKRGMMPCYILGNEIATFVYLLIIRHTQNIRGLKFNEFQVCPIYPKLLPHIKYACKLVSDGFLEKIESINLNINGETMKVTFKQLVKHFGYAGKAFGKCVCGKNETGSRNEPGSCNECNYIIKFDSMVVISRYVSSVVMDDGNIYVLQSGDEEYNSNDFIVGYKPPTLEYSEDILSSITAKSRYNDI